METGKLLSAECDSQQLGQVMFNRYTAWPFEDKLIIKKAPEGIRKQWFIEVKKKDERTKTQLQGKQQFQLSGRG